MHIYWFKDSKTGHLKQVDALLNELKKDSKFLLTHVDCLDKKFSLENIESIFAEPPKTNQTVVLIGAGHGVYENILNSKKFLIKKFNNQAIAIAILRPSKKLKSFDMICAPQHDFDNKTLPKNVTTFIGSLAEPSYSPVDKSQAMIAIGGISKHYKFDGDVLLGQLQFILSMYQSYEFRIFNSRRTPDSINLKIEEELSKHSNAQFIDFNSMESNSFQKSLQQAALKFVTPDSVNLTYESLSTPGKTYLIQIETPSYRRIFGSRKIRESMSKLVKSRQVGVVSLFEKKGGINVSKIENPSEYIEPLAEVEKLAYSIINFISIQK